MNSIKQNEELKALDSLFQASARYKQSKNFIELLEFINRFPKLSPFNAFLIHMQNSGVKLVLSHSKWKEYNREVKFNARPMVILMPFGPVEFVFDIADTFGEEVPEYLLNPFYTVGSFDGVIYQNVLKNLSKEGIIFEEREMHKGSAGVAERLNTERFKITINSSFDLNTRFSTLVHELAHILCGHLGTFTDYKLPSRRGFTEDVVELEAESVSFLVCKRIGLKTTSEPYLYEYLKNNPSGTLPSISFDLILTVTNQIEQLMRSHYQVKLRGNSKKI